MPQTQLSISTSEVVKEWWVGVGVGWPWEGKIQPKTAKSANAVDMILLFGEALGSNSPL